VAIELLRDIATATTTDLVASDCDCLLGWLSQGVAAPPNGLDVILAAAGVSELLSELAYEDVDDLGVRLVVQSDLKMSTVVSRSAPNSAQPKLSPTAFPPHGCLTASTLLTANIRDWCGISWIFVLIRARLLGRPPQDDTRCFGGNLCFSHPATPPTNICEPNNFHAAPFRSVRSVAGDGGGLFCV
jgi:hypothetical protein